MATQLSKLLECIICNEYIKSTPIYECGSNNHNMLICKICHPLLEECPMCRGPLGFARNRFAESLLEEFSNQCPQLRCQFSGNSTELETHQNVCNYALIECSLSNCNTRVPRILMEKHILNCDHNLIVCPNIEFGCNLNISKRLIKEHELICDFRKIQCRFCNNNISKMKLDNHMNQDCEAKPFKCLMTNECNEFLISTHAFKHYKKYHGFISKEMGRDGFKFSYQNIFQNQILIFRHRHLYWRCDQIKNDFYLLWICVNGDNQFNIQLNIRSSMNNDDSISQFKFEPLQLGSKSLNGEEIMNFGKSFIIPKVQLDEFIINPVKHIIHLIISK